MQLILSDSSHLDHLAHLSHCARLVHFVHKAHLTYIYTYIYIKFMKNNHLVYVTRPCICSFGAPVLTSVLLDIT